MRILAAAVLAALALYLGIVGGGLADDPPVPAPDPAPVEVTVQGKTAAQWHHVAAMYRRKLLIRWRPSVDYAYRLASALFGVPYSQLHAVGGCESHHYPFARNGKYRGVLQEGSMFETGPLGRAGFSVWDPIANVLTGAMVVRHDGGWGQWECKP
jgi:hypothetical protein